jgi:plasmid maintenance system antidote protein VapI
MSLFNAGNTTRTMKTKSGLTKYTPKELAEGFVFRSELSAKEQQEAGKQLKEARKKAQQEITPNQQVVFRLMQLKFQMEDYIKGAGYNAKLSFGHFLREYVLSLDKNNRAFAKDIDIDETELSQIINNHRKPSEKLMIRLEIHSNKTIPAIIWYKLLEKEREHEMMTDNVMRLRERKHVKNRIQAGI